MRRLAVLVTALTVSACAAFQSAPPPVRTYRLAYPAPAPEAATPLGVVRVGPIGTARATDRLDFLYRDGEYAIGIDHYHAWIAPPAGMLADLLARDVAAAGLASAVIQGASPLPADYELSGRVEEVEESPAGGCTAHLLLRARLVRVEATGPREVVFEDTFASDQPCTPGDPDAFAGAMSRAAQDVSGQLRARMAAR